MPNFLVYAHSKRKPARFDRTTQKNANRILNAKAKALVDLSHFLL